MSIKEMAEGSIPSKQKYGEPEDTIKQNSERTMKKDNENSNLNGKDTGTKKKSEMLTKN